MFIIILSIFVIVIFLFWDTIKLILKTLNNSSLENGYLWFAILLIINTIIIIFLIAYYYYKSNQSGDDGIPGKSGFVGLEGDISYIPVECSKE